MGGGYSSRLFVEVREKEGLAYSVYSFNSQSSYLGYLVIYIDSFIENLEKANKELADSQSTYDKSASSVESLSKEIESASSGSLD